MLILDLWGISFHAVVVFGLGKNLLFKSVLGHCDLIDLLAWAHINLNDSQVFSGVLIYFMF